jgi:hypothetical protein
MKRITYLGLELLVQGAAAGGRDRGGGAGMTACTVLCTLYCC